MAKDTKSASRSVVEMKPERGWRMVYRRVEEAARLVAEGKLSSRDAARRFQKAPAIEDLEHWAADYRTLGKTAFQAKYGSRSTTRGGAARPGEFDYDNLPTVLKKSIHKLEVEEQQLQDQLRAVRAKLEKARKHLEFAESEAGSR